jgi:sugar lactone lactonase YvrE
MAMSIGNVEIAVPGSDLLGESPIWDAEEGALYWVDIRAGLVRRWHMASGMLGEHRFDDLACFVALGPRPGRLLAGTRKTIGWIDFGRAGMTPMAEIEPDLPRNRLNEARVDPFGAIVFGTMLDGDRAPAGALYRLTADARPARMLSGIAVPNSLAWSPDGTTMYFADTWRHVIWQFGYGADGIVPGTRRVFVDLMPVSGRPDGAAIDVAGCLWSAQPGTGRVVRYRPDGRQDLAISIPARDVTALCFGGADMKTIFVTSATQKLGPTELLAEPASGSVFAIQSNVAGFVASRVKE